MTVRRTGSPPQVRGKLKNRAVKALDPGITPAGAGKTLRLCNFVCLEQDHPRRCGENADYSAVHLHMFRITPAGAGKTRCLYLPARFS